MVPFPVLVVLCPPPPSTLAASTLLPQFWLKTILAQVGTPKMVVPLEPWGILLLQKLLSFLRASGAKTPSKAIETIHIVKPKVRSTVPSVHTSISLDDSMHSKTPSQQLREARQRKTNAAKKNGQEEFICLCSQVENMQEVKVR
jgi:hypothetical protein